jgi:hypothetical protein
MEALARPATASSLAESDYAVCLTCLGDPHNHMFCMHIFFIAFVSIRQDVAQLEHNQRFQAAVLRNMEKQSTKFNEIIGLFCYNTLTLLFDMRCVSLMDCRGQNP